MDPNNNEVKSLTNGQLGGGGDIFGLGSTTNPIPINSQPSCLGYTNGGGFATRGPLQTTLSLDTPVTSMSSTLDHFNQFIREATRYQNGRESQSQHVNGNSFKRTDNQSDVFSALSNLQLEDCQSSKCFESHSVDYPLLFSTFRKIMAKDPYFLMTALKNDENGQDNAEEKKKAYSLIIKQLLFDGYNEIAHQLANIVGIVDGFHSDNTLQKVSAFIHHIESRCNSDIKCLNLLNWYMSFNNLEVVSPGEEHSSPNLARSSSISTLTVKSEPAVDSSAVSSASSINGDTQSSLSSRREYTKTLSVVYKFGSIGPAAGYLDKPHGFCVGTNDDIVIADTNNHRISVFSVEGVFKFSFGERGMDAGKLFQPRKIAMLPPNAAIESGDKEPVYIICDRGSKRSRMQVFKVTGEFVRLIDIPFMDIVSGLTTTQDRRIVVVDSVRSSVLILDEVGTIFNWFTCSPHMIEPSDIAVHDGKFYICDFKGHCVNIFNTHGTKIGQLSSPLIKFPNGIDIADHGDIIVGDSHGNRFHVSVFSDKGEVEGEYECPYLKVSRCCGLKITSEGFIVTLAKNNNHVVVMNSIELPPN